jgi:hypothetical protein
MPSRSFRPILAMIPSYMQSRGLVRRLSSTALRIVVALCVGSVPQAKAGSSHRPVRLDGVQSGAILLRQIRDVTTLIYVPKSGGATRSLKLSTPDGIFRGSFDRATLIGEIPGKVVLLSDTYGSRPHGGSHECGAGEETFLRVVALDAPLRETITIRVESCWLTYELEGDGIDWIASQRLVRIFLITPDDPDPKGPQEYAVSDDGTVTRIH